jgi:translation initiation factor IF-3
LDLVELSPNAEPPVCKVLDYGKYKFEQQKKASLAKKKQVVQQVKEIKMRPSIDVHDYQTKMKAVNKFIDHGDKVKLTIRFRGREMSHMELGMDVLKRIEADIEGVAKVEARPKLEGRQMTMVISPK